VVISGRLSRNISHNGAFGQAFSCMVVVGRLFWILIHRFSAARCANRRWRRGRPHGTRARATSLEGSNRQTVSKALCRQDMVQLKSDHAPTRAEPSGHLRERSAGWRGITETKSGPGATSQVTP